MKSAVYPEWIDFEWFAVDAHGHVAVFTTGGDGPIPAVALDAQSSFGAFDELMRGLPPRTTPEMLVLLPRPDDYIQFAAQGLFAYGWGLVVGRTQRHTGFYELYSRPAAPVFAHELPAQAQQLLQHAVFSTLRFSDSLHVNVRTIFPCSESAT